MNLPHKPVVEIVSCLMQYSFLVTVTLDSFGAATCPVKGHMASFCGNVGAVTKYWPIRCKWK